MKRRMQPREPPQRPAIHPKDKLAIEVKHHAAVNEKLFSQNQQIVDQIRRAGKSSSNFLMRTAMMETNPIFANGTVLPDSLTTASFGQSKYPETIAAPVKPREDMVTGGSGESLFFVSRGIAPSVIPAKLPSDGNESSTMKDSYIDHPAENRRIISAKNAGQAQAKDWAEAAQRKKDLEKELDALDAQIGQEEGRVYEAAARHGLFGRSTMTGTFKQDDDDRTRFSTMNSSMIPGTERPLKGLSVGGTTMKDTFQEHTQKERMVYRNGRYQCFNGKNPVGGMKYSILAPDTDDVNAPLILKGKDPKLVTIGKFKDVRIPSDPGAMTMKPGSQVCGSAFRWKGTSDKSSAAEAYSWPTDKMINYDHDKEEVVEHHKFGSYEITKTRYGEGAKECDLGKSVFVKSRKEIRRHLAKCM